MAQPVTPPGTGASGRLFVLPGPEELARAAAGRLCWIARERAAAAARAPSGSRGIFVALSGGQTPRRAFEALAAAPYRDRFPWDLVRFFQADERWLPPGDPRSNRRLVEEALLSLAPAPAGSFLPVDTGRGEARDGASRYEAALRNAFPRAAASPGRFPRFDAILLGMGRDGHTASLFPGSAALMESSAWVVATEGGDPPLPRVTLTLPVLNAAAHVIFLVSGKEKAQALAQVIAAEGRDDAILPAARVSPVRGTLTYLADAEAAAGVRGARP